MSNLPLTSKMLRTCTRSILQHQPSSLLLQCSAGPSRTIARVGFAHLRRNKEGSNSFPTIRTFSHTTSPVRQQQQQSSSSPPARSGTEDKDQSTLADEPKLSLTFTCTANECGHRSTHQFTKRSYERGIVLVQCPSCKNRHLIADHLGWFTDTKDQPKTIEQIVTAHGGRVRRGVQYEGENGYETMEILSDSDDVNGKK